MQVSRQLLATLIRRFARGAIEGDDQKYGRQLATICEQTALALRAHLGGKPMWELSVPARKRPPPAIQQAGELVVLSQEEQSRREHALWVELAAAKNPRGVVSSDERVWREIMDLGLKSDDFILPIERSRRTGEPLDIDNLPTGVQHSTEVGSAPSTPGSLNEPA